MIQRAYEEPGAFPGRGQDVVPSVYSNASNGWILSITWLVTNPRAQANARPPCATSTGRLDSMGFVNKVDGQNQEVSCADIVKHCLNGCRADGWPLASEMTHSLRPLPVQGEAGGVPRPCHVHACLLPCTSWSRRGCTAGSRAAH